MRIIVNALKSFFSSELITNPQPYMNFLHTKNNDDDVEEEVEDTESGIDDSMLDEISEEVATPEEPEGFGHIKEDDPEEEEEEKKDEDAEDSETLEEDAEDVDYDSFDDEDPL